MSFCHIAEADKNSTTFFSSGNHQNKTPERGVVTGLITDSTPLSEDMIMVFLDVTLFTCITSCIQALGQLDPKATLAFKCTCLTLVKTKIVKTMPHPLPTLKKNKHPH